MQFWVTAARVWYRSFQSNLVNSSAILVQFWHSLATVWFSSSWYWMPFLLFQCSFRLIYVRFSWLLHSRTIFVPFWCHFRTNEIAAVQLQSNSVINHCHIPYNVQSNVSVPLQRDSDAHSEQLDCYLRATPQCRLRAIEVGLPPSAIYGTAIAMKVSNSNRPQKYIICCLTRKKKHNGFDTMTRAICGHW